MNKSTLNKLISLKPWILAVLSGVIWFLSCPPYPFWFMAWFAMLPLFYAIEDATPKKSFLLGWVAGIVGTTGGFPWIMDLVIRFAHLPSFIAFFILLIYSFYQGLIFALFTLIITKLKDKYPLWLVASVAVVVIEYLFPLIFPWYFAITQAFVTPVIQITEITGPPGVAFLLMLFSGGIYTIIRKLTSSEKLKYANFTPFIILLLVFAWSFWRISDIRSKMKKADTIGVAMIQHNMGILLGQTRYTVHKELVLHQELSKMAEGLRDSQQIPKLDLITWTESSYPYNFTREQKTDFQDRGNRKDIRKVKRGFTTNLIFGVGTETGKGKDRKVYNSALLLDKNGNVAGRYDKKWLLMFGEYIPFYEYLGFLHDFFRKHNLSNMSRGKKASLIRLQTKNKIVKVGPLICYEDILPSFGRETAALGAEVLVNITNDAWFGARQEPYEHLALAVLRTTETRLAMIRNVNNGVSALIMPDGSIKTLAPAKEARKDPNPRENPNIFRERISSDSLISIGNGIWQLPVWPHSYLIIGEVPVMPASSTFFTKFGDVFSWISILILLFMFFKDNKDLKLKFKILKHKLLKR